MLMREAGFLEGRPGSPRPGLDAAPREAQALPARSRDHPVRHAGLAPAAMAGSQATRRVINEYRLVA